MRKLILFFLVITSMVPTLLYAQKVVTGTVRDAGGVLPGASVVEKGVSGNATVTNNNGFFKLTLKSKSDTIVVRFLGYISQSIRVGTKNQNIDITLNSSVNDLTEVMVVAYGKTTRITNTGSVSSMSAADIRTVPTANVQNALAGKLPGYFSTQASGQPGKDASDFFIRGVSSLNPNGNKPLIIVDDIEYTYDELQQINVNEIESISILKDASTTAIYGIKGANGVLVVTTRRGKLGKPQINFRNEAGLQSPTKTPQFLDSYHSALLVNQAETNDGKPLSFTQADLTAFKNGTDPYGHPNVDWYNKIFKKYAYQANSNLDISGGNDQVKYFISGGMLTQNGLQRDFPNPVANLNSNYDFKRYNFRSNLDLKVNKTLDLRLDVTTRFTDVNQPVESETSTLSEIYDFTRETPFTAPFLNPNGSYAYAFSPFNPSHLPTLNARIATEGYQDTKRTDYNLLFNGVQKLDFITTGLSITGRIAYSSSEAYSRSTFNFNAPIPSYHYNSVTGITTLNPNGSYVYPGYNYIGNTNLYTTNVDLQFISNYEHVFEEKHHVSGFLLFKQTAQTYDANDAGLSSDQVGVPAKSRGISLNVAYDYNSIYLFDLKAAYNGTDRFAANHRYSLFPAMSVGYNISKEKYFKPLQNLFGLLKIRASYGMVGSDVAPGNTYIYTQNYLQPGGSYPFGSSPFGTTIYTEGAQANTNVVWEKQKETDIGIDLNMLKNNALSITFDYFHNIRYDQLVFPQNVPLILGVGMPAVNMSRTQNQGFDGQIGYHNHIGDVQLGASFVFSIAKNKILNMGEATPAYPWLAKTGQPINQPFGYHSLGYYSQADVTEIAAYKAIHGSNAGNKIAVPDNGEVIQPGDLKYQDLNGDGYINVFDERAIGHPNIPNTTLGLNLNAAYKGFSMSVLFQGSFGYSFIINGIGIEPFESQFQPIHEQAWTTDNAANAQFPRLTTNPSTINSPTYYPSDYWQVNAYYVRLKTIDIGYQFPSKNLPLHLNSARIYLSAYNLFTWDNYKRYQQDPEVSTNTAGDAYINQRVVSFGLQLGF